MKKPLIITSFVFALILHADSWPQWRGPLGTGVSAEKGLPTSWSKDNNVAWRVPLNGLGVSAPIAWGDRVFVTYQRGTGVVRPGPTLVQGGNAAEAGELPLGGVRPSAATEKVTFAVAALDAKSGKQVWEATLDAEGPLPEVHEKRNLATSSPVTDGERVYAWFANGQMLVVDMNGKQLWTRHLGKDHTAFDLQWGFASSPVIYKDRLILSIYQPSSSYLLALDKASGKQIYKVDRDKDMRSYSTPLLIETPSGPELIVNSSARLEAFEPLSGKLLWQYDEETRFAVPMPVFHDGILYATRGYRSGPFMAMKLGQRGALSKSQLLWHVPTGAPYLSSLVYHDGLLYSAGDVGITTCIDARTGERVWQERIDRMIFTASPLVADGKIYLFSETGETVVLKPGRTFEVLARNKIDERIIASPAIANGQILIRSDKNLTAIRAAAR